MRKGMLKRILAGFMAFALTFMSVDAGCITAIAADLQENSVGLELNTGLLEMELIPTPVTEQTEETEKPEIYQEWYDQYYGSSYYTNEWEKYSSYYYYNQLNDEYKATWDELNDLCLLYLTTTNDVTSISVELPSSLTEEEVQLFAALFVYSNPQYYFVDNRVGYSYIPDTGEIVSISLGVYDAFSDGLARAEATEEFESEIETALGVIMTSESEEEMLQLAHDYIVNMVSYNNDAANNVVDEQNSFSQSAYSTFCLNSTVCAGYSEALQLLCNGVGIDAVSVTSATHQWNKVRINDSWYNVDATWADQSSGIYYQYFGRNDEFYESDDSNHIAESHWDSWAPICTLDINPSDPWSGPGVYSEVINTTEAPVINAEKTNDEYAVTITSSTPNATIYYTVDGTSPSAASSKSYIYSETFTVAEGTVVKAIAVYNTYWDSEIVSKEITNVSNVEIIVSDIAEQTYSGSPITPDVVVTTADGVTLIKDTAYTVSYSNNTDVGTASVTVTFIGDYAGKEAITKEFDIVARTKEDFVIEVSDQVYDGTEKMPVPVVRYGDYELVKDTDYLVEYENNINAGDATIYIVFIGNYNDVGTVSETFTITPIELDNELLTFADEDGIPLIDENGDSITKFTYTYTRDEIIPNVIVSCGELVFTKDGELTFDIVFPKDADDQEADHTNAGTVEFTVVLKGNYSGEITGTLEILRKSSDELDIGSVQTNIPYTGEEIIPTITIWHEDDFNKTLVKDVDYVVSVAEDSESNGIEVGTVKVCISFIGNYEGADIYKEFEIVPANITSEDVDINDVTGYISKITAGTTVEDFLTLLDESQSVKVFKGNDAVANDALLATGMKVCVMNGTQISKEYIVVVTGDTNGDGKISITDMIDVKAHLLKRELLTGASEKAADVAGSTDGGDGKVSITDFIKVKAHLLKRETIIGVVVK